MTPPIKPTSLGSNFSSWTESRGGKVKGRFDFFLNPRLCAWGGILMSSTNPSRLAKKKKKKKKKKNKKEMRDAITSWYRET